MTGTMAAPVASAADLVVGGVRDDVGRALEEFLAAKSAAAPDECLVPVIAAVREFLAGGKCLRPVFCHCGWLAGGGDPDAPGIARIGAALELFHAFALIHDDIMDGSDTRRGRPAMHRSLAKSCEAGDASAERFGVNAAILVGDLCLVWSDELLNTAGISADRLAAVRPLVHDMRTEVMAGQYLDLGEPGADERFSHAWRTIRLKTAGYTVERPLQIGATLAGADPAVLRACSRYGRPLGEAFQLRDDLLGVFGSPGRTGKPVLDDLREGKPTVLMALAWQRASRRERDTIAALHGDPDLDEPGAEVLRRIVRATGADTTVERLVRDRIDQAVTAMAGVPMPDLARLALTELAGLMGSRDH